MAYPFKEIQLVRIQTFKHFLYMISSPVDLTGHSGLRLEFCFRTLTETLFWVLPVILMDLKPIWIKPDRNKLIKLGYFKRIRVFQYRKDYIQSLLENPPAGFDYHILRAFEEGPFVNLIYQFSKDDISVTMSQLFEIHQQRIIRILLIFDSGKFVEE